MQLPLFHWNDLDSGRPPSWMPGRSWLFRRYYPSAEEAIDEVKIFVQDRKEPGPYYVIRMRVYPGAERYWPTPYYWRVGTKPPFHGRSGYFYYPIPQHYIVDAGSIIPEMFAEAEDQAKADEIQRQLTAEFAILQERDRKRRECATDDGPGGEHVESPPEHSPAVEQPGNSQALPDRPPR